MVDPRRFAAFASRWEANHSAAAVQPAAVSSPPDCCIKWFESPLKHIKTDTSARCLFFGGPEEIRTPDPYNANVMRSQLRYGPITVAIITPLDGIVKWVSPLLRVLSRFSPFPFGEFCDRITSETA